MIEPIESKKETHDEAMRRIFAGDKVLNLLHPIFRACVASDATRYNLALPWHKDGFAYACDGRIVVRSPVPARAAALVEGCKPDRGKVPDAPALFADNAAVAYEPEPVALPEKSPPAWVVCPECDGWGWIVDGPVDDLCGFCDGARAVASLDRVDIAPGFGLAALFVEMARRFGAKVYLPAERRRGETFNPARLLIEPAGAGDWRVEGLVMPMAAEGA